MVSRNFKIRIIILSCLVFSSSNWAVAGYNPFERQNYEALNAALGVALATSHVFQLAGVPNDTCRYAINNAAVVCAAGKAIADCRRPRRELTPLEASVRNEALIDLAGTTAVTAYQWSLGQNKLVPSNILRAQVIATTTALLSAGPKLYQWWSGLATASKYALNYARTGQFVREKRSNESIRILQEKAQEELRIKAQQDLAKASQSFQPLRTVAATSDPIATNQPKEIAPNSPPPPKPHEYSWANLKKLTADTAIRNEALASLNKDQSNIAIWSSAMKQAASDHGTFTVEERKILRSILDTLGEDHAARYLKQLRPSGSINATASVGDGDSWTQLETKLYDYVSKKVHPKKPKSS